jgi:PAS domain-containing protein
MHPFAGLDGDRLRPPLAGSVPRQARPLPAPLSLRRLEPLAAVFLGLHGVMVLANLGASGWWRWAGVGLVLALGLAGLGGRGPAWMVQARALAILVVGIALQATAGGAGGWFAAWPFVLVAVYPLALPGPAGVVVAGLAVLGYVLVVRLAGPAVGPALAVARVVLLAGLAGVALVAAAAYARMANLAVEAELELGRRERLGRALLDALTDPTAVLDPHGRVVAVNQAWSLSAAAAPARDPAAAPEGDSAAAPAGDPAAARAGDPAGGPALAAAGQSYPEACRAAAAAGYDGLEAAAGGLAEVLGGQAALFRCRYRAPGGVGPYELTATPLAGGEGAVVTHRPPPTAAPTHGGRHPDPPV